MSREAMEAVQDHTRYQGNEDFVPFRIMLAIARFADKNGIAGKEGDPDASPSTRTIADTAHVHRNSVNRWLPLLVEAGELRIEKYGRGRAAHMVFTILLPICVVPLSDNIGTTQNNGTTVQSNDVSIMRQEMAAMAQQISEIHHLMAQGNGTNGTTVQRAIVQDTYIKKEEEYIYTDETDAEFQERAWADVQKMGDYWYNLTGKSRPKEMTDKDMKGTYEPLARLWRRLEGDVDRANQLIKDKRLQMITRNFTPSTPEHVVIGIFADLDVAMSPSINGRHHEPANMLSGL